MYCTVWFYRLLFLSSFVICIFCHKWIHITCVVYSNIHLYIYIFTYFNSNVKTIVIELLKTTCLQKNYVSKHAVTIKQKNQSACQLFLHRFRNKSNGCFIFIIYYLYIFYITLYIFLYSLSSLSNNTFIVFITIWIFIFVFVVCLCILYLNIV